MINISFYIYLIALSVITGIMPSLYDTNDCHIKTA